MNARRTVVHFVAAGGLVAALLGGCSAETRDRILPYFFDGVARSDQRANPPTRRVRRNFVAEIEQLKRELADTRAALEAKEEGGRVRKSQPPIEAAQTWKEAAKLLPIDAAGAADWGKAVESGVIRPRPGPDPETPQQAVLDMDVELPAPSKVFTVIYPHAAHTEWLACGNCHPAIFPLKRGAEPLEITMVMVRAGQYCGVCHGKVAFALDGHCSRCHSRIPATAARPAEARPGKPIEAVRTWDEAIKLLPSVADGSPDWPKALDDGAIAPRAGVDPKAGDQAVLPLDVELVPKESPQMKAIFPHETHTKILACRTCHTDIFQMAAGADPIDMQKIFAGEYCGRCHGKVAFQVATGCPRCHPVLAGK